MDESQPHLNALPFGVLHKIFGFLGSRDLCRACAVCVLWRDLNRDAETDRHWCRAYSLRWGPPGEARVDRRRSWQAHFAAKVLRTRVWRGKCEQDNLFGHNAGVRSVKLLPECNLVATGSMDKTVRLWDLNLGMPLAVSKSHGGTVRCLALGPEQLISGSSDKTIRVWRRHPDPDCFSDLTCPIKLQGIHTGPISGLALCGSHFVSGSWDCSVRIWSNTTLQCEKVWRYGDWVWTVMVKGRFIAVSVGHEVLFQDLETGSLVQRVHDARGEGKVSCIEGSQDGALLVTGTDNGSVLLYDLRTKYPVAELWRHHAGISGLSFEDPWVVSCALDGTVALVNTETFSNQREALGGGPLFGSAANRRQLSSLGSPAYCVHMADCWIACGSESSVVRTWDFSKAEESARRTAAQKIQRRARRQRVSDRPKKLRHRENERSDESSGVDADELAEKAPLERGEVSTIDHSVPAEAHYSQDRLVSGMLRLTLPDCCRSEARRLSWRQIMRRASRGGESTDDGDVLEGLA